MNTTVGGAPQTSNSESGHGFGDVSLGLAKTLLQEGAGWWPDVIARVTWDADTGKTDDNGVFLGGGFNELSGSLSAVKRQDPLAFVGSVSYAKTFEHDDIEPGDEVGFSLGTVLAASPETSLSFFFNQTFADDTKFDGDTINGSDQVIGTLSLGAATILGTQRAAQYYGRDRLDRRCAGLRNRRILAHSFRFAYFLAIQGALRSRPKLGRKMVARTPIFVLVLCLALSPAVVPVAAKADPRVLTTSELAAVTAGRMILAPIQINLNHTVQVARATVSLDRDLHCVHQCDRDRVLPGHSLQRQYGGTDKPRVLTGAPARTRAATRAARPGPGG